MTRRKAPELLSKLVKSLALFLKNNNYTVISAIVFMV